MELELDEKIIRGVRVQDVKIGVRAEERMKR